MKKILLLGIGIIGIGTAGYFLLRKSNTELKGDILKLAALDRQEDITRLANILNRMTRQELLDMHRLESMGLRENTPKEIWDKIDPAFKARITAISSKYNIFT